MAAPSVGRYGAPLSPANPGLTPRLAALMFLVLALTPEIKFRTREAGDAFSGSLDLQILVELAIWGAVGIWVARQVLHGAATGSYPLSALDANATALLLVTLVVLVSGGYSLSVRSGIRAIQFAELSVTTLLLLWEGRRDRMFFPEFWLWVRRGMVAFAVAISVPTAAFPGWGTLVDDFGIARYSWFQIHPIATGGIIGLTLVMLVSGFLGWPDPLLGRKGAHWMAGATGLGLTWLLLRTRSRGVMVATLVAVALLFLLSQQRGRRRAAFLMAAVLIVGFIAYLFNGGSAQLEEWILRGQTTEQVRSMSERTALFQIGWELFDAQPVFGYGYLLAGTIFHTYYSWAGHAHNVFLETMISMGLLGLTAYAVLIGVALRGLWRGMRIRSIRRSGHPAEGLALLAFLIGLGVVSDSFGGPVGFETAGLMLVLLFASWSSHPGPAPAALPHNHPAHQV